MKKNKTNKAIVYIIILAVLIAGGLYWKYHKNNTSTPFVDNVEQTEETTPSVSIGSIEIKEENFTGKVATIEGESELAQKSQAYIDGAIAEFKKTADTDVPDMREKFGVDNPTAQYEIDIDAKYLNNETTESVVMLTYTYTGGAHGSSVYKTITMSDGKTLSLADVIKKEKQNAFTALVKKELLKWKPEGAGGMPAFPEDVQALNFNSFTEWSLNDKNLIIYFSQYEIGPGALGSIEFPLPIEKIKDFLK